MTDQEFKDHLRNNILPYYEEDLRVIEGMEDVLEIRGYLFKRSSDSGICYLSLEIFDLNINTHVKDKYKLKYGLFWASTPFILYTKSEILSSHKRRIEIMKEIINS